MFDDVIRWLLMGLGQQTKAEKKWVEAHPLRLPTDDEQIRKARVVLEAAEMIIPCVAEIPKDGRWYQVTATFRQGEHPFKWDGLMLRALPDAKDGDK